MNYRIRMRNLREDRDLTQREVGEIINKSQQGYSHIEEGRAELKIEDLMKGKGIGEKIFAKIKDDIIL